MLFISARPAAIKASEPWKFSEKPIEWYHILSSQDNVLSMHSSAHWWRTEVEPKRFCTAVRRKNYPSETTDNLRGGGGTGGSSGVRVGGAGSRPWIQPAHTITFLPPVVVVNLLPCHLIYKFKGDGVMGEGSISPGKQSFVSVDIEKSMVAEFSLDSFPIVGELQLPAGRLNFESRIELGDCDQRQLQLLARVESSHGGAVRICVFVKHWLVNKTGLPLIFRQDGECSIS